MNYPPAPETATNPPIFVSHSLKAQMRQLVPFSAAFWLAVTAIHMGEALVGRMRVDWESALVRIGGGALGFALSLALAVVVFDRSRREPDPRLPQVLGVAALLAIVHSGADYLAWFVILAEPAPLSAPVMLVLNWSYRLSLLLAWYGLYSAMLYSTALRERENRLLEARAQAQEAQLRALRYQVNPHLLFNALNALSALVVTGQSRAASDMIDKLARFYRAVLAPDSTLKVSLAQEIELQAHYLDIERTRFPDRLRFNSSVEPGLERALVPHLLLQPLVENAVRHGVASTLEPVEIRLHARRDAGFLVLRVENGGARPGNAAPSGAAGIGLTNVRERLRAYYGKSGTLSAGALPGGGFRVELRLPLELTL